MRHAPDVAARPLRRGRAVLAAAAILATLAPACSGSRPPVDARADTAPPPPDALAGRDGAPPLDAQPPDDAPLDASSPDDDTTVLPDADAAVPPDAAPLDAPAPDDALDPDAPAPDAGPPALRIMAGNLTSGSAQSYTPGHGIRIFAGLHPDVALVQEFNYATNSAADLRAFVDMAFGPAFQFVRGAGDIPNGVVSRYPLIASGEWLDPSVSNRTFVWARIDVPGPRDLWAVSLHLLSSSGTSRATQAMNVATHVQTDVPAGDLLVIGGDFNTDARTEAAVTALGAVVDTAGPYPADQAGNSNTNSTRAHPYDWVLADADLAALEVPVAIGANTFARGLVFDTRVYTPLSDVAPARATDSAASGMQHMGVVRDFLLAP